MEDIFEGNTRAPEKRFRYPVYERFLWLVVIVAGVAAVFGYSHIREFVETDPLRGWVGLGIVGFFLLVIIWISVRAWASKIIISPTSIKVKVIGQGYLRISWRHVQSVVYKWRPLGHKLILIGSDGARVGFRSSISEYDIMLDFIRQNVPEHVADQLEEIFGEEEEEEGEEQEEEEEEEADEEERTE